MRFGFFAQEKLCSKGLVPRDCHDGSSYCLVLKFLLFSESQLKKLFSFQNNCGRWWSNGSTVCAIHSNCSDTDKSDNRELFAELTCVTFFVVQLCDRTFDNVTKNNNRTIRSRAVVSHVIPRSAHLKQKIRDLYPNNVRWIPFCIPLQDFCVRLTNMLFLPPKLNCWFRPKRATQSPESFSTRPGNTNWPKKLQLNCGATQTSVELPPTREWPKSKSKSAMRYQIKDWANLGCPGCNLQGTILQLQAKISNHIKGWLTRMAVSARTRATWTGVRCTELFSNAERQALVCGMSLEWKLQLVTLSHFSEVAQSLRNHQFTIFADIPWPWSCLCTDKSFAIGVRKQSFYL